MTNADPIVALLVSFQERFNHVTDEIIKTQNFDRAASKADYEKLESRMSELFTDLNKVKACIPISESIPAELSGNLKDIRTWMSLFMQPVFWIGVVAVLGLLVLAGIDFDALISKAFEAATVKKVVADE